MNEHSSERSEPRTDATILRFLFTLGVLLSPATYLWTANGAPWWVMFVLWGSLISLVAVSNRWT